jgi:hypothetical protein
MHDVIDPSKQATNTLLNYSSCHWLIKLCIKNFLNFGFIYLTRSLVGVSWYKTLGTFLGPPSLVIPTTSLPILRHLTNATKVNSVGHRASLCTPHLS